MTGSAQFSVVIVGAGPAGSATAIWCAAAGLRTLLLDREVFPRHRPGETLHPGIEPLLRQLGVWEVVEAQAFLRHEGHWVTTQGIRRFERFGEDAQGVWRGFQLWRPDFDTLLLARARELGVEIRQPCAAQQPILDSGRVVGVVTSQSEVHSRIVVDAGGSTHWLARHLGGGIDTYSPRLVARYGYLEGECPERDAAPELALDTLGWTWTAQVRTGIYQWTRLWFDSQQADSGWRPEAFHGFRPYGRVAGADVTWRRAACVAGPGYFLAGDAATVLDPASSHGVLKAIMSGIFIGHCIRQMLCASYSEPQATHAYAEWMQRWFRADVATLKTLYEIAR